MGLLDLFSSHPKISRFSVCAYGKLPCHREYFHVSLDPAFDTFKMALVEGVEQFDRRKVPKPLVLPNQRFFVRMRGFKADLAGCVWDSNDGSRVFPFMLAVALPKKFRTGGQKVFFTGLDLLWTYLERYGADLRQQPNAAEVYRRIRAVEHPAIVINTDNEPREAMRPAHFTELALNGNPEQERRDFVGLHFQEPPSYLCLPMLLEPSPGLTRVGYVGFSGLIDFNMNHLRTGAELFTGEIPVTAIAAQTLETIPEDVITLTQMDESFPDPHRGPLEQKEEPQAMAEEPAAKVEADTDLEAPYDDIDTLHFEEEDVPKPLEKPSASEGLWRE